MDMVYLVLFLPYKNGSVVNLQNGDKVGTLTRFCPITYTWCTKNEHFKSR